MRTRISILLLAMLISACVPLQKPTSSPEFTVTVEEPQRIRFYGKGAGAGMMLMSSMGPMGIAVGVAIDEGIGKDIDKAAVAAAFDMESIARQAFRAAAKENPSTKKITAIKVQRYGFVTRSGDGDPVAAQQHIAIVFADGEELVVKYPEEFGDEVVETAGLDRVKVDGELVVGMHRKAVKRIVDRFLSVLEQKY